MLAKLIEQDASDVALPYVDVYLEAAKEARSGKDSFLGRFFGSAIFIQTGQVQRAKQLFRDAVDLLPTQERFGPGEQAQIIAVLGDLEPRLAANDDSDETARLADRLRSGIQAAQ